jgi:hypothetical protein
MDDLTYEFQRMVSRSAEIREATKSKGPEAAWEQYSREHGLTRQRFRTELPKLRRQFDGVASGRKGS